MHVHTAAAAARRLGCHPRVHACAEAACHISRGVPLPPGPAPLTQGGIQGEARGALAECDHHVAHAAVHAVASGLPEGRDRWGGLVGWRRGGGWGARSRACVCVKARGGAASADEGRAGQLPMPLPCAARRTLRVLHESLPACKACCRLHQRQRHLPVPPRRQGTPAPPHSPAPPLPGPPPPPPKNSPPSPCPGASHHPGCHWTPGRCDRCQR